MHQPMFVRALSPVERRELESGLRSRDAFVLRRSQILLASGRGDRVEAIAAAVGCSRQAVRNVIHRFGACGLGALGRQSTRPRTAVPELDAAGRERLKEILHRSPRAFGKDRSTWTLGLLAEVAHERGLTKGRVSRETVRVAVARLGVGWKRAKQWITSPDPLYAEKKARRDRLIRVAAGRTDCVLGFLDEVWWSRLAQPQMHAWGEEALRLTEHKADKADPDPKAIACYGLLRRYTGAAGDPREGMLLRFVSGRPVSHVTCDFLAWACGELAKEGKSVLLLVWDNAAWHVSKEVRAWVKAHNREAKANGGVRIRVCHLPVKAPWLNPIEPKWVHGKRAVAEPDRKLAAQELKRRICDYYGCDDLPPLAQKVA